MATSFTPIGIDVVKIRKVRHLWDNHRQRIIGVIFTDRELKEIRRRNEAELTSCAVLSARQVSHLAAKFAAKEAAIKALSLPYDLEYDLRDIEIIGLNTFSVKLYNSLPDYAKRMGFSHFKGSSAISNQVAIAVVIGGSDD